jgi:hypothetical protein
MRKLRTAAVAFAVVGLVLVGAPSAVADPPETTILLFDDLTIDDRTCGFLIVEVFDGTVRITTYVDDEGNPTRIRIAALFEGTLTNPETGESIRGQQELIIFVDLEQATEETWAGLRFRAVFPGAGAVLLDAGRLIFDTNTGEVLFEAGPHQVFHEDFEAYCAHFSS